jgi:hypothetical protein
MPTAPPPPLRILPSSVKYLVELSSRRGRGGAVFVLNDNQQPCEVFEAAVIFFQWGARKANRARKLLEAELVLLENAQWKPRVRPSSLPFFQKEWKNVQQCVFDVDDTVGPLELFDRLAHFMHWTEKVRREHRLKLSEELADHIDAQYGTLEGLRNILRQYNERKGKIRWSEADIATMSTRVCKQLIKTQIHVNIHDYTNGSERQFSSYSQLRTYTLGNHQFFPLDAAKANGLTSVLLKDFRRKREGGRQGLSDLMDGLKL